MTTRSRTAVKVVVTVLGLAVAGSLGVVHGWKSLGSAWPVHDVVFYVNPANLDVPEADAEAAVRAAADAWSVQSGADVKLVYGGRTAGSVVMNNGYNEVFFRNESSGERVAVTYFWADSAGRVLDADILFYDGANRFFTGASGCVSGYYVEDVATHEFGHALGLDHSLDFAATMYPIAGGCSQAWRSLASDDITGILALYPSNSPPPLPPPSAPSGPSPAAGAGNVSPDADLAWACTGADDYDVYLGTASPAAAYAVRLKTTSLALPRLASGTKYYWRVVARNAGGTTPGPEWSFTTKGRAKR